MNKHSPLPGNAKGNAIQGGHPKAGSNSTPTLAFIEIPQLSNLDDDELGMMLPAVSHARGNIAKGRIATRLLFKERHS